MDQVPHSLVVNQGQTYRPRLKKVASKDGFVDKKFVWIKYKPLCSCKSEDQAEPSVSPANLLRGNVNVTLDEK